MTLAALDARLARLRAMPSSPLVTLISSAIWDRLGPNVGIVLSGGLDSSVVASLAPYEIPTFTGYYAEDGFDERVWARYAMHPEHHEIEITPQDSWTISTRCAP
jgi:asparagine synthetase B (glutamine-hydrolysing)